MRGFHIVLCLLCLCSTLVGCAGQARVFQDSIAAIRNADKFNDQASLATLVPTFGYLRVHSVRGATLMLWLFVDKDPNSDTPIDVWLSGDKEIVKLQNGRIVSSVGLGNDWLSARYEGAPNWTQVLASTTLTPYTYSRSVDHQNNYQFGKKEVVRLTRISQPVGHALAGVQQPSIVWFEEKSSSSEMPPNIYGVVPNWANLGQAKVVYTWHCFKADDCMGFQVWTTVDQEYVKARKP